MQAAGVTFPKVIFHLLQNVLNQNFWISLAVISYFSHQYFSHFSLATVTLHSILNQCMEDSGAKKRDFDQHYTSVVFFCPFSVYFRFSGRFCFSFKIWQCDVCFALTSTIIKNCHRHKESTIRFGYETKIHKC